MIKTVRHLAEQLAGIRSGTLSIGFVETFRVSIGGNSVAIGRMAGRLRGAGPIPFIPGLAIPRGSGAGGSSGVSPAPAR